MNDGRARSRGQANLVAVAVAFVLLTSVLGASLAVAESALADAVTERDATDRYAASTLAARLVDDAPASYPPNVVPNRSLTIDAIESLAPVVENASVRVDLGGRTLVERGDTSDGTTVYRGVLVGTPTAHRMTVNLTADDAASVPHRTDRAALGIVPGPNTTVHTVRVNGRVVLYNETGLAGEAVVPTARDRETELTFGMRTRNATVGNENASSPRNEPIGRVEVSYTTIDVETARLAVTVDV